MAGLDDGIIDSSSADKLKSFVKRLENLMDEKDALGNDLKEVFAEMKSEGFDVPTVKKILSERRKDPLKLEEEDMLKETYKIALES